MLIAIHLNNSFQLLKGNLTYIDANENEMNYGYNPNTASEAEKYKKIFLTQASSFVAATGSFMFEFHFQIHITEHNTQGSGRPIYIKEQLTRHKQQIFNMARDLKREHRVEYAWAKNGDIYVRKTADCSAIKIANKEQLNDI